MATITVEMLGSRGATCSQVDRFVELFGDSVEVTVERAVSVASEFDWYWVARRLLSETAWKAYLVMRKTAFDVYAASTQPARDAYVAAGETAGARDVYEAATKPARDAYEAADAAAFAEAYIAQEGE